MDRDEMSNLYRGPAIDASYQVSIHLALYRVKVELKTGYFLYDFLSEKSATRTTIQSTMEIKTR
jgi:hypothetical protein